MPRLYLLSGPDLGTTHEFHDPLVPLVIGRAKDADLTVRATSVSRHHARIEFEGDGWFVVDTGSRNGVTVDGRRVERAALSDHSEFLLGDLEVRFRLESSAEPKARAQSAPAPAAPAPAPPTEPEDIELEGDWSEAPAAPAPPSRKEAPAPAPAKRTPTADSQRAQKNQAARAAALGGTRGESKTKAGGRVLQYSRVEQREGLLAADISQQPTWVRWALYLLLGAAFAGLVYGAFHVTRFLRTDSAIESP